MVAGIFLNSVVIISLWKSTQLRKKLCYFMIFILSYFDLAVVVINHPIIIWFSIETFLEIRIELLHSIAVHTSILLGGYSLLALLTLNFERYLALNYPFFHQKSVTKKRVLLSLACICFLNTILTALTLQDLVISYRLKSIIILSNLLFIIFFLTYKIVKIAITKAPTDVQESLRTNRKSKIRGAKILKTFFTCYLAVLCYFICYTPVIIYSSVCIDYWNPNGEMCNVKIGLWITTSAIMNSTFNCLVFFWRNSILRREGMKVIKCCWTS